MRIQMEIMYEYHLIATKALGCIAYEKSACTGNGHKAIPGLLCRWNTHCSATGMVHFSVG